MAKVLEMPGFPQRQLTSEQRRHLMRLEARRRRAEVQLAEIEREWAALAEETGYSAMAREMGLTPEAVRKRVRRATSQ
jgi:DNA-binding Lrp family transcriptional regulator